MITPHPERLKKCEVLIIGGGISGLGVALEASYWGLSTILLERGTICSGTSAQSLRIIHGGIRYLQTLELSRVIESQVEQSYWLKEEPELIKELPCFMPLEADGMRSRVPMFLAGKFYQALGFLGSRTVPIARIIPAKALPEDLKDFAPLFAHGAFHWQDAQLSNPQEFASRLVAQARNHGAHLYEGEEFEALKEAETGVEVRSRTVSGESNTFQTKVVINCSGQSISVKNGTLNPITDSCRGFNIILSTKLCEGAALGVRARSKRLFFFVPRGSGTAIGTGYLPLRPDKLPRVGDEEVAAFLSEASSALGGRMFSHRDIAHIECGHLPRERSAGGEPLPQGKYRIEVRRRVIEVTATKYTTFRSQARKVIELARPLLRES